MAVAFAAITIAPPEQHGLLVTAAWLPTAAAVVIGAVKRFHDRDRGAHWLLIYFIAPPTVLLPALFPLAAFLREQRMSESVVTVIIVLLMIPASIVMWGGAIELFFLRGTRGRNRFGTDPLDPPHIAEAFE